MREHGGVPVGCGVWTGQESRQSLASLTDVYRKAATDFGAASAPCGYAWSLIPAERPNYPLWEVDGHHTYHSGGYVSSCVIATVMMGGLITVGSSAPGRNGGCVVHEKYRGRAIVRPLSR